MARARARPATAPVARKRPSQLFGVLLIDKPPGPTSHDIVGWVRWALRERAVGHCGTLDPPASGLLVVCVGAATKLVEHLSGVDKRYRARFVLGRSTSTADAEGETLAEAPVPAGLDDRALSCLRSLVGDLELPPPAVSAVKLDGRRAHELARAGETPELPPRPMSVRELEIEDHGREGDRLWIDADLKVSKGSYVRSLAQELGRRLDLPAHLGALRRTACGELSVEDPLVVTNLVPVELPPIEGRPPKWRVELPGEPQVSPEQRAGEGALDARARAGALLRAHMSDPWSRLPFETRELPGEGPHEPLLARLLQGQRLRADAPTLAALGLSVGEGPCALVDRAGGHLIVLRRERARLAPSRVLSFPPH
jgi:tRNA pseudouridine55 synthase